jgi:cytochrome c peroxidase
MHWRHTLLVAAGIAAAALATRVGAEHHEPDRAALIEQARAVFGTLPVEVADESNPLSPEKIELGRMLYYDARLSRNQEISCNSCHLLDRFGVDGQATSPGQGGQRGDRNSPTVYNAALYFAQFWDGRAADLEEQAKGPVLNPIEMAMRSEADTVAVLRSIPGYSERFRKAFPADPDPLRYDNMARAIAAFERRLMTPAPFDAFLAGDAEALSEAQVRGLATFIQTGCVTCHLGPAVGGTLYRKLGLLKPYPDDDPGRFQVTGREEDLQVFKVPSLRNVAKTGPWFHDGSIASLDQAIRIMSEHQLGVTLDAAQVAAIRSFLESLTGTPDAAYVARPQLPESGLETPAPDPS